MNMNAIRMFVEVKDGKIAVDLPEGTQVEVIVIPKAKTDDIPNSIAAEPTATYRRMEQNDNIFAFAQPPRTEVTLEQLIAEQGNKKFDYQAFKKTSDEIEWEESMIELIEIVQAMS